jgi:ABC-type phosphate transport system permease subunit
MPNQLEAFKIAERTRINCQHLIWVMMLSIILGTLASFWAFLHLMYKVGALSVHGYIIGIGNEVFGRRLERWINNPIAPNIIGTQSMIIGASMTSILYFITAPVYMVAFSPNRLCYDRCDLGRTI